MSTSDRDDMVWKRITVDGERRRYWEHEPLDRAEEGWPALISLHGAGHNGKTHINKWESAFDRGVTIVCPSSTRPYEGHTVYWVVPGHSPAPDSMVDVDFIEALYKKLKKEGAGKVCLGGFSSGAAFTWWMWLRSGKVNRVAFDGYHMIGVTCHKDVVNPGPGVVPVFMKMGDAEGGFVPEKRLSFYQSLTKVVKVNGGSTFHYEKKDLGRTCRRKTASSRLYKPPFVGGAPTMAQVVDGGGHWFEFCPYYQIADQVVRFYKQAGLY